jgi:hypothetical protein
MKRCPIKRKYPISFEKELKLKRPFVFQNLPKFIKDQLVCVWCVYKRIKNVSGIGLLPKDVLKCIIQEKIILSQLPDIALSDIPDLVELKSLSKQRQDRLYRFIGLEDVFRMAPLGKFPLLQDLKYVSPFKIECTQTHLYIIFGLYINRDMSVVDTIHDFDDKNRIVSVADIDNCVFGFNVDSFYISNIDESNVENWEWGWNLSLEYIVANK